MESKMAEVYITSPSKWMAVDQESFQPSKLDMEGATPKVELEILNQYDDDVTALAVNIKDDYDL